MRPLIILLGLPGSGKGTQGKRLAAERGMAYLATGDLVREVSRRAGTGDTFADEVAQRNRKGTPQPDEVIFEILRRKLQSVDLSKGIVLDAFPISLGQTQLLNRIIEEFHLSLPKVLFITIDEWECVKRLTQRKFCLQCNTAFNPGSDDYKKGICSNDGAKLLTRNDDQFAVVLKRMQQYSFRMRNISLYYRHKGWLIDINGQQPIDSVYKEILGQVSGPETDAR